jgi:hypothetical protein
MIYDMKSLEQSENVKRDTFEPSVATESSFVTLDSAFYI